MTKPTPTSVGPIRVDPPERQAAGLSTPIRHPARLTALRRLALLDGPAEQAFDRLTRLATKILHAPVALLSLVDGERSFFKSSVGLPELWASRREMPLAQSVCQHVVTTNAPLLINDARAHPLVSDNQAVAALRIVAYLGIPLVTSEGHVLGTIAVIDTVPRVWTADDVTSLGDLAASAMTEIEMRAATNQHLLMEQRLHLMESVVGNATAAVFIAEADPAEPSHPRIVFVNDAYTRLTGYAPDEVVGRTHQILNTAQTNRSQTDALHTALATWKPARLELLTHRKDGSAFWAEWNIVPIADKAGRYSHWVVLQRDISEPKAAAEALRESEARRQAILESSLDCILLLDHQEHVIEFNPAAERTFGYGRAEAMGKPLVELIVPPLQDGSPTLGLAHYATTEKHSLLKKRLEMTALRADGTQFPAELVFTTIPLNGPVFTVFLRDITERKRAERLLAAQYTCTRIIADTVIMDHTIPKLLRVVCEHLGWCLGQMWQLDPQAGLLRCAAVWHEPVAAVADFATLSRKTTCRPSVGLLGRVWASRAPLWVSDVTRDANFSRTQAASRCGLHGFFAFPILHGEEVLGVMEFFHETIREPDGALLAMITAVGNQAGQFIERMRADEALRRAKEVAEEANRAKSAFFSQMSHELRTPLTVILGFGQLLELEALSAPQRESAEQIVKAGWHLLALINEVLDIARIEAGGVGMISPEEVDVGEVLGEVLGMIKPLADKALVQLQTTPSGTWTCAVHADRQRLKQILLNLLSNAIKYNRAGGTVTVSWAAAAAACLRIEVTDTGLGILPEKMYRLFAPFDRLEAEQKGLEGTGLGLTLSKGLAEAMQGKMGAESTVGQGSTFWVELPQISETKASARAEAAALPASGAMVRRAGTVLCIEDNPSNFRLVERLLKLRPGVRLLSAIQGSLGLELARQHHPDIIFLDLHLPDLQGDEVLRRLRDDDATRDIPVIVVSADATPSQVERLLAAGASRYLVKPLDVKEFLQILDETLTEGSVTT